MSVLYGDYTLFSTVPDASAWERWCVLKYASMEWQYIIASCIIIATTALILLPFMLVTQVVHNITAHHE